MNKVTDTSNKKSLEVKEEIWNVISHGIGIPIGLFVLGLLIWKAIQREADAVFITAHVIYAISFLWTYLTSTVYHALFRSSEKWRRRANMLDHTAIYLFIAGTYTPIALYYLPGFWSNFILVSIWVLALSGIIYKYFSLGKRIKLSTYLYLAMGWLIVIAAKPLYDTAPLSLILWIAAGGLFYSIGTFFFLRERMAYNHAVWHLFVLLGSACHFIGIYYFI